MIRPFLMLLVFAVSSSVLAAPPQAQADEIVRYQLTEWKRKHIHDLEKADRIADSLKKLGCEVQKAEHNGHIDVRYRCPQWRQIKPATHDEAVRWEKWFKEFGFRVQHLHGPTDIAP